MNFPALAQFSFTPSNRIFRYILPSNLKRFPNEYQDLDKHLWYELHIIRQIPKNLSNQISYFEKKFLGKSICRRYEQSLSQSYLDSRPSFVKKHFYLIA